MPSPYQRAKPPAQFDIPEVRDELLHSSRLLYAIVRCEQEGDPLKASLAQQRFNRFAQQAFKEALHDLVEDVHNSLGWALRQPTLPKNVIRAAVLFGGALLAHKETAVALPLLKRLETVVNWDRELKSVWAINSAIGQERLTRAPSEDHWETAIQAMPLDRWMHYPSLADGARNLILNLRSAQDDAGDLQSLLRAIPLAERAYAALTQRVVKGSDFECSGSGVRLLIEVARTQHAATQGGLGPLNMPPPVDLFKEAITNAAVNKNEEDLFTRSLASLAEHYSTCGDRENAKNFALQGIIECANLKNRHPDLLRALREIFEANKDSED